MAGGIPGGAPDSLDFDAIVVGAGPAGSSAAYRLAQAGRSVVLLDKHSFPRQKVCGDCLTPRGVRLLSEMGVLTKLLQLGEPTKGCGIFSTRGGAAITAWPAFKDYPRNGLVISRALLDTVLKDHAVLAGAAFEAPVQVADVIVEDGVVKGVRAKRGGQEVVYRAPVVIAADGTDSVIARGAFGLTRDDARAVGLAFRVYFEGVDSAGGYMEIYGEDHVLPGCGWVFPMGHGRANVGVGIYAADFARRDLDWHAYFDEFVGESPWVRARLAGARRDGPIRGARLLMGGYKRPVVRPGMLLTGDAAALVNPLTGEGVMYALESGGLAAEAVDRALTDAEARDSGDGPLSDGRRIPAAFLDYQRELDRRFNRYFALGCQLIRIAKMPAFVNPGVSLLKRRKGLSEANLRFWTSIF
jgi:menaquinone-9 beta-reductase